MKLGYLAVIPAMVLAASDAQASVVIVTQTLDLAQTDFASSGFTGVQSAPAFSPPFSVALAEGDTFDFTIHFKPGQTLTLNNPSFIWAYSYADIVSNVTGTGVFSFLDAAGLPFLSSLPKTDTEGEIHFGQNYDSGDFVGGLPSSITFSGVQYTGTVDDYVDPAVTSRVYSDPALYFTASSSLIRTGAVPELATWGMMLLGFGAVGGTMRRRKITTRITYA